MLCVPWERSLLLHRLVPSCVQVPTHRLALQLPSYREGSPGSYMLPWEEGHMKSILRGLCDLVQGCFFVDKQLLTLPSSLSCGFILIYVCTTKKQSFTESSPSPLKKKKKRKYNRTVLIEQIGETKEHLITCLSQTLPSTQRALMLFQFSAL